MWDDNSSDGFFNFFTKDPVPSMQIYSEFCTKIAAYSGVQ